MDIALQAIKVTVTTLVETIEEIVSRIITAIRECASKMMKQLKSILKTAEVTLSVIDVDYMDYAKVKIMVETGKKMLEKEGYPFKSKHHSEMWQIWANNHNAMSAIKYRDGLYNFSANKCPKILRYQFDESYSGPRISDKCCLNLKEKPLDDYMSETGKTVAIVGIMREEGGRRESAQCFVKYSKNNYHFHPLAVVSKEWEQWFIDKYHIRLCDIYYPPYNFTRTGCKGCPFNPILQKDLDTLERYFPKERQQCEVIWKPVYDEYRKIGYRLKKQRQTTIFDYLEEEKND